MVLGAFDVKARAVTVNCFVDFSPSPSILFMERKYVLPSSLFPPE